MWEKFKDYGQEWVSRGTIFRFKAKYPYEEVVDFMLYEPHPYNDCMMWMVVTGHKAGLSPQAIPMKKLGLEPENRAIPTKWLIENWADWVYGESSIEDVYIMKNYAEPDWPPA